MEIVNLIFDKLGMLVMLGVLGVEVWYYFIIPGLKEMDKRSPKKKREDEDSD